MAVKLIAYACVAPDHQPTLLHPDKLTVNEGEWAFCPFDARAADHRWQKTGGADLASLTLRFGLSPMPVASENAKTTG